MTTSMFKKVLPAVLGVAALFTALPEASAQEIQITGPLAGAPAVRRLRLHRDGRFDVGLHGSFTLLDEYRRTIMPGLKANYFFTDWIGAGVFGGFGVQYNAALSDELQEKAVDARECDQNPQSLPCKRTAASLCRGSECLSEKQLGRFQWIVAPQVTVVPFRGKFGLFGLATMDTDISIFLGPAIIGLEERAECMSPDCTDPGSFVLESRVTAAPTFGLGFNFYPLDFLSFGAEFRAVPFAWNTSGFDVAGGGLDDDFPDDSIDGDDRTLRFNPMLTVFVAGQFPTAVTISD